MKKSALMAAILGAALLSGCLLISGTFVIVEKFTFTTQDSKLYSATVDLTAESDWEKHKDQIDNIDLVGFELWLTNPSGSSFTFNAFIDTVRTPRYSTVANVQARTTKILDNLTVVPGSNHVTYGNSFKYLTNVDQLKKLVKKGLFDCYGTSSGGSTAFTVDSAKVIVTFTASGS